MTIRPILLTLLLLLFTTTGTTAIPPLQRFTLAACHALLWTRHKAPPSYLWGTNFRTLQWYHRGHETFSATGTTPLGDVEIWISPERASLELRELVSAYPLDTKDTNKILQRFQPISIERLPETDPQMRHHTRRRIKFTLEKDGDDTEEFDARVIRFMRFMFETLPEQKTNAPIKVEVRVDERIL